MFVKVFKWNFIAVHFQRFIQHKKCASGVNIYLFTNVCIYLFINCLYIYLLSIEPSSFASVFFFVPLKKKPRVWNTIMTQGKLWQNLHFWVNYLMLSLEPETHSQFSYWLFHVCVCLMITCSLYSYYFKYIVWKVFLLFQSPKIQWHLNILKKTLIIHVPPFEKLWQKAN